MFMTWEVGGFVLVKGCLVARMCQTYCSETNWIVAPAMMSQWRLYIRSPDAEDHDDMATHLRGWLLRYLPSLSLGCVPLLFMYIRPPLQAKKTRKLSS